MHDVAAVQERHALGDLRSQRDHQRHVRRAGAAAGVRAQQPALYRRLRATRTSNYAQHLRSQHLRLGFQALGPAECSIGKPRKE